MPNETPDDSRRARRGIWAMVHWRFVVLGCITVLLSYVGDYRPDAIALAAAPYQFSAAAWELGNLPDKWFHRIASGPRSDFGDGNNGQIPAEIREFFDLGERLRSIDRKLIELETQQPAAGPAGETASLRLEQARLRQRQARLRPGVEEALETAVADVLEAEGFKAWTGVFPPVDTVLTGSPTVLITSPRDRIARGDDVILRTGLSNDQRDRVEAGVESETGLSALVVNTGGIAFYPSITLPDAGLEFALEVIAHEWIHQWLWFRPLGRRYFHGGDITAINETVSDIAGREIGELAQRRLEGMAQPRAGQHSHGPTEGERRPATNPSAFDFQAEMRATRERVDELLEADEVLAAEAYMEERRRMFVDNGYLIRRLNQAYFAFHGTYATTGAAGVNVIGQQVEELRRRSPTLEHFIRTAAEIKEPADLSELLSDPVR